MNVVGYIRVSTQGQAKDGYSLKYQEDEIKALEIDRAGLQNMLAHLSSVQIDYVVVLNTSRLWRSDIVKVLIQRELKKHCCDIKSIEQPCYSIIRKTPMIFGKRFNGVIRPIPTA